MTVGQRGELGNHGQAEAVGVGAVDAADQRIDEPLVDLVAEPARINAPMRVAVRRAGAGTARARPAPCRRHDSRPLRARRRCRSARRAAARRGWRAGRRATPRPARRSGEVSASPSPTPPGQRRRRTGHRARNASAPSSTAGRPANGAGPDLAAEPVVGLEHLDVDVAALTRPVSECAAVEAGDAAADHDDARCHGARRRPSHHESGQRADHRRVVVDDAVRSKASPRSSARGLASMSRS